MDYFAGLDISMDETHVCVVDRDGAVVYEGKSASMAEAIADELAKAPSCGRVVFETGRMAPILFHGLRELAGTLHCRRLWRRPIGNNTSSKLLKFSHQGPKDVRWRHFQLWTSDVF